MEYVLMSRDIDVLRFRMNRFEEVVNLAKLVRIVLSDITILDDELLPLTLIPTEKGLRSWLLERKIPNNRAYVNTLLDAIADTDNPFRYLDITYGLSLNDTYWVRPATECISWANINLYDNPFSDVVASIAFTGEQSHIKGIVTTPEFTTNGMLKKCWHREGSEIFLYKGATPRYANGGLESLIEVYASQIADVMGLPHVPYKMAEFHGQQVCACPLFTSESIGYLPLSGLIDSDMTRDELILYEKQYDIASLYGIREFANMMVFDALIYNTDRHLNNFGVLVHNESNTILGAAPLFDHGNSLLYNLTDEEFFEVVSINTKNSQNRYREIHPLIGRSFWGLDFDTQAKLYLHDSHRAMLQRLLHFTFHRISSELITDTKLDALEQHIQQRALYFIELLNEKHINFAI